MKKRTAPRYAGPFYCATSGPLVANITRAVDHAPRRCLDPFTDYSAVIAIKGVAVAPMTMTPAIAGIAHTDANATRTGAEIDLCASGNGCGKRSDAPAVLAARPKIT